MRQAMNTLVFGGVACTAIDVCETLPPLRDGSTSASSVATRVLLGNACHGAAAEEAKCLQVEGGVLGSGLLGATTSIGRLARLALTARMADINASKGSVLDKARVQAVASLTFPYVRDAFDRAAEGLISSTVGVLAEGESISVTATWVFAMVYMLVTIIWLNSQVPELAWPLRTSRRLVRFLPADLVIAVPSLRVGLRDVAAGAVQGAQVSRPLCPRRVHKPRVAVSEPKVHSSGRGSVIEADVSTG